jgi:hypothetical protein
MILSFLKKLFSRKNETMSDNTIPRKHKLEIQIYEADYEDVPDGYPPKWKSVRMDKPVVVEVADEHEFAMIRQQYAMCDQKIKVIREIDPFDDKPVINNKQDDVKNVSEQKSNVIENNVTSNVIQSNTTQSDTINHPVSVSTVQPQSTTITKSKPKIVTIGDTQIKYDGDKVYSRQWVKLNSKESSFIRLVNDSNNKLVNLNGKHFEALRWVLVENDSSNDDIDSSIEAILNDN